MEFIEELSDLEHSEGFFKWMLKLSGESADADRVRQECENIEHLGLYGYCEDVALYFYCNYEYVHIVQTNYHFVIEYDGKFYDAHNRTGEEELKNMKFFKDHPDASRVIKQYDGETFLPRYYYSIAKSLRFPCAERINFARR